MTLYILQSIYNMYLAMIDKCPKLHQNRSQNVLDSKNFLGGGGGGGMPPDPPSRCARSAHWAHDKTGALTFAVADLGGVRGVQIYPPLAASSVFLRT